MPRTLDAVIFDMDGVLIDSEPIHFGILRQVLAADGYALSAVENEDFLGWTSEAMFATLIARHNLPRSVVDYSALYDAALLRELRQARSPQPGVVSLIHRLRELGFKLAVASSSRHTWVVATLQSLALGNTFDTLVSGEDVERGKPDPSIYLLAAARLAVPADRCVAIEDSPSGVQSARAAGIRVLGVRTPYTAHLRLEGADRLVDSLADLDLSGEVFA
jgi:HAD superfamily hydrolase (TIGR01509 family)